MSMPRPATRGKDSFARRYIMPLGDGTGPFWRGRGKGFQTGFRAGRGAGWRGAGICLRVRGVVGERVEESFLADQKSYLEARLKVVQARMNELQSGSQRS